MAYTVKSPLVVAHTVGDDGVPAGDVHVYEGGTLPENVDETQLKQLIDSKMVEETADEDKPKRGRKADESGE